MTDPSTTILGVTGLIALYAVVMSPAPAFAHSPHDNIAVVAVSPEYRDDETLFVVVLGQLQRSTDGGSTWKRLKQGLDSPSVISSVAISPEIANDDTALAATRDDGIYVSADRGTSWHRLAAQPENLSLTDLIISPNFGDDRIILAQGGTGGLYLSNDAGDNWKTILENDVRVLNAAIVPGRDSAELFALLNDGTIRRRSVTGSDWHSIPDFQDKDSYLLRPIRRPSGEFLLFVATEMATYITDDSGNIIYETRMPDGGLGESPGQITAVDLMPGNELVPELIVAAWHGGAYVTGESAGSWQATSEGLTKDIQADQYGRPHFRELAVRGEIVFLSAFDGLFRSDNGGASWIELETLSARNPTSFDIAAADHTEAKLVVSNYDEGIYFSDDSGSSWTDLNRGLGNMHVWSVVFERDTPDAPLLLAATNRSLYRRESTDVAWQRNILGCRGEQARQSQIERAWNRVKYFFVDQPRCRHTFPHEITFSPYRDDGGIVFFGTRYEGIFRSDDNGVTWRNVHDGMGGWVSRIAPSPNQPLDQTVFATVRGKGVLRSTDDGNSWTQVASREILETLTHHPNLPVPIAVSPQVASDGRIFVGTASGLFGSDDFGDTWHRISVAKSVRGNDGILDVALSPKFAQDGFMLVSLKGHGLYASDDAAKTFRPIAAHLIAANHELSRIRITNNDVYAMSEEELFVSTDRGESWQVIARPR